MTSTPRAKEITLDFRFTGSSEDPQGFPSEDREYEIFVRDHTRKLSSFPWRDSKVREDLAGLMASNPEPAALKRLGKRLRRFLDGTNWPLAEAEIERRAKERQPIDIVISSNAPEIYALPWELLELEPSGRWLGELDECLVRYDWAQKSLHEPRLPEPERLLLAWSDAGGGVPFTEHEQAIRAACEKTRLQLDVLPRVTHNSLKKALADPARPVAILHLLCHGTTTRSGAYGLALNREGVDNVSDQIDATELQQFFPSHSPPRLVVLCVCRSGDAGEPHILGNLAQNLHRQDVPAVIASRMPLSCLGSNLFTQVLYTELLAGDGDLRSAFLKARRKLLVEQRRKDWASLQFYARRHHEEAFDPLGRRFRPGAAAPKGELVLIRHEAYDTVSSAPELTGWHVRKIVHIDQTPLLKQRQWENLEAAVESLTAPEGDLQRALAEPATEFGYYGFPFVPLGVLAGFLAGRSRRVHVFEPDPVTKRFTWSEEGNPPELKIDEQPGKAKSGAMRLRISLSSKVALADCRKVLPDRSVSLDLHARVDAPAPGLVRSEAQARAYAEMLSDAIYRKYAEKECPIKSIHVFAAIPVSIAFLLGQAIRATWLPDCHVYNYGFREKPRYKWRLCLQAALHRERSIKIFNES
jgi:hypothetical protein